MISSPHRRDHYPVHTDLNHELLSQFGVRGKAWGHDKLARTLRMGGVCVDFYTDMQTAGRGEGERHARGHGRCCEVGLPACDDEGSGDGALRRGRCERPRVREGRGREGQVAHEAEDGATEEMKEREDPEPRGAYDVYAPKLARLTLECKRMRKQQDHERRERLEEELGAATRQLGWATVRRVCRQLVWRGRVEELANDSTTRPRRT